MSEECKKDENCCKKSSGTGKFFLGAAFGALAGAVASKFFSSRAKSTEDELEDLDGDAEDFAVNPEDTTEAAEEPVKKTTKKPASTKKK